MPTGAGLYTIQEAAEYLGCSKQTIYNRISGKRIEIPHYKIMGRVLFKESDLKEYVNNCRVKKFA